MQSGDEYDVSCRGHTGFDASMTSQKGDFRTNEALVLKFGLFGSRIPVKVVITQPFRYLLSVIVHATQMSTRFYFEVFFPLSMKKFSGTSFFVVNSDGMTC